MHFASYTFKNPVNRKQDLKLMSTSIINKIILGSRGIKGACLVLNEHTGYYLKKGKWTLSYKILTRHFNYPDNEVVYIAEQHYIQEEVN